MIYIFSSKSVETLGFGKKDTGIQLLPVKPGTELSILKSSGHDGQKPDQVYIDVEDLTPAEVKRSLGQLKKGAGFWGIIDPKGEAEDPAAFFFEGANDYIGSALVKKGLNKKRFASAFSWFCSREICGRGEEADDADAKGKGIKLPAGQFEGWKSIRPGTEGTFFFLFVSLTAKANLRSMLSDAAFSATRSALRDVLQQGLFQAEALLWMETEQNSVFLVPPRKANVQAAIEASLRLLANNHLLAVEKLGLTFPVELTFALHYGDTLFQAPGKTGAVISESVNYIFHLGAKKAETLRLTVSGDVPEEAFPEGLKDIFVPSGLFEGIPIRHSRRFTNQ